jgi:hypothetical protein
MIDLTKPIRTLGLYQPYAGLVMDGKKPIETRWIRRGRKAPFPPGVYLIYATKKSYTIPESAQLMGNQWPRFKEIYNAKGSADWTFAREGSALCLVEITKHVYIIPNDPIMEAETWVRYDGPVTEGKRKKDGTVESVTYVLVGLVIGTVLPIEPFTFKGKQGVGFLSDSDKTKIKFL